MKKSLRGAKRRSNLRNLSHLDARGRVRMVDVAEKPPTRRTATAESRVAASRETMKLVRGGHIAKGDVGAVVRIAAIQAAKRTADLVPLCHPIPLEEIAVDVRFDGRGMTISARVSTTARTGVEMEAMTAAAVGAVTFYDMIKGVERGAVIGPIRLLHKDGGRSGAFHRSSRGA